MRAAALWVALLWVALATATDSPAPEMNPCCQRGELMYPNTAAGEIKCGNQTMSKSLKCVDGEWKEESEMANGETKRKWEEDTKRNETHVR